MSRGKGSAVVAAMAAVAVVPYLWIEDSGTLPDLQVSTSPHEWSVLPKLRYSALSTSSHHHLTLHNNTDAVCFLLKAFNISNADAQYMSDTLHKVQSLTKDKVAAVFSDLVHTLRSVGHTLGAAIPSAAKADKD